MACWKVKKCVKPDPSMKDMNNPFHIDLCEKKKELVYKKREFADKDICICRKVLRKDFKDFNMGQRVCEICPMDDEYICMYQTGLTTDQFYRLSVKAEMPLTTINLYVNKYKKPFKFCMYCYNLEHDIYKELQEFANENVNRVCEFVKMDYEKQLRLKQEMKVYLGTDAITNYAYFMNKKYRVTFSRPLISPSIKEESCDSLHPIIQGTRVV